MFSLQQVIEFLTKLSASITTTEQLSAEHEDIIKRIVNLEVSNSKRILEVLDDDGKPSADSLVTRKWVEDHVERMIDGADYIDSYDVMDKIHDAVQEMDVEDHVSDAISNYDFSDEIMSAVDATIEAGQGHDTILDMVRESIKDTRIEIYPG